MPLKNIEQPYIVNISNVLRLIKYDGDYTEALTWYQDRFVYYNSEGISDPMKKPNNEYIERMYTYLDQNSELYFIEFLCDGRFMRIGDVAIKPINPPIVIGNGAYRGKGYSKQIMAYVISRLRELGYKKIENSVVYKHNIVSKNMHISLGFEVTSESENEYLLSLDL